MSSSNIGTAVSADSFSTPSELTKSSLPPNETLRNPPRLRCISCTEPLILINDAALEMMGDDYVANEAKNVPADVISSGEFVKYLDSDSLAIYDEMWTKLKE